MNSQDLQLEQAQYDEKYWQDNGSEDNKIRHITLHLGKSLGKLAAYCDGVEHNLPHSRQQIVDEVIPDLLMYALQLSNITAVDLLQRYRTRIRSNVQKRA